MPTILYRSSALPVIAIKYRSAFLIVKLGQEDSPDK